MFDEGVDESLVDAVESQPGTIAVFNAATNRWEPKPMAGDSGPKKESPAAAKIKAWLRDRKAKE